MLYLLGKKNTFKSSWSFSFTLSYIGSPSSFTSEAKQFSRYAMAFSSSASNFRKLPTRFGRTCVCFGRNAKTAFTWTLLLNGLWQCKMWMLFSLRSSHLKRTFDGFLFFRADHHWGWLSRLLPSSSPVSLPSFTKSWKILHIVPLRVLPNRFELYGWNSPVLLVFSGPVSHLKDELHILI